MDRSLNRIQIWGWKERAVLNQFERVESLSVTGCSMCFAATVAKQQCLKRRQKKVWPLLCVMKNKGKGIGKRRTGGGRTKGKLNKAVARNGFESRHIDQVGRLGLMEEIIFYFQDCASIFACQCPFLAAPERLQQRLIAMQTSV